MCIFRPDFRIFLPVFRSISQKVYPNIFIWGVHHLDIGPHNRTFSSDVLNLFSLIFFQEWDGGGGTEDPSQQVFILGRQYFGVIPFFLYICL